MTGNTQNSPQPLLIFGASARAAAFSALRAGLQPVAADLFADQDLLYRCPVFRVPVKDYPEDFLRVSCENPPGPWMYAGALENWPRLVEEIAALRPLWGNHAHTLALTRSPRFIATVLKKAALPCPLVWTEPPGPQSPVRWLQKPVRSAGGVGVRFWNGKALPKRPTTYLQEYVEGEAQAALYLGDGSGARLLGVTRQLTGQAWLHASAFHYSGSIGPLVLESSLQTAFGNLGQALAAGCNLRGLFGVDCVVRDSTPWPVEINPRYTASVEVLEYALGIQALAFHRRAFDPTAPEPAAPSASAPLPLVGKAILYAGAPLIFPRSGPWSETLRSPPPCDQLPLFADIPAAGEHIGAGKPVLTFFTHSKTADDCLASLRQIAATLDRWLFDR